MPALLILLGLLAWRGLALDAAGLSLHFDEAQYWVWSTALDWGYYSKPPVIASLYWFTDLLIGNDPGAFRLAAGLLYTGAAVLAGLIARDAFGAGHAIPTALVFACIPGIAVSAGFLTTDAPLTLCWALALFSLQRAISAQGHWGHWCGVGLALGLGLLSKYTMGAFALCALGMLACMPAYRPLLRRTGPWVALFIAALVFAPNVLWNAQHGFPTLSHTQEISQIERAGLHLDRLLEFILGQFIVGGPLLLVSAFLAARSARLHQLPQSANDHQAMVRLAWFTLPLLILACIQATISRAQINWALPAYLSLTVIVVATILRAHPRRLGIATLANVVILACFLHWPILRAAASLAPGQRGDLFARFYGWPQMGQRLLQTLNLHTTPAGASQVVLVNEDRANLARLAYELRRPLARIASWNPEGRQADHWSRFADLAQRASNPGAPEQFLIVSTTITDAALQQAFSKVTRLADDPGPGCQICPRPWGIWLAEGFRGYRNPAGDAR